MTSKQYGAASLQTGNIVTVTLDFDNDTLSFAIDGNDFGIAWHGGFAGKELYPAVSLNGTGDKVMIQNYRYLQSASPSTQLDLNV